MRLDQPPSKHVSDHLANERTYLAWLRTSFSLLTLGFATSKFGQFITELHSKSEQNLPHGMQGTRRFGIGMALLGVILTIYSTWNYNSNRQRIEAEDFRPNSAMIWVCGLSAFAFGVTAMLLLFEQ